MLNTLRFPDEIRTPRDMGLKVPESKGTGLAAREISLAEKLIAEMTEPWKPAKYHDAYREDLMERIQEKVRNKETHTLTEAPKGTKAQKSAEIIDLMDVLKKSLGQGRKPARRAAGGHRSKKKAARA